MQDQDFYNQILSWIEEEFQEVRTVDDERNPGPLIEFKHGQGGMVIGFNRERDDKCVIIRRINIDTPHQNALRSLDSTIRSQLRHDFAYEFASYNIPYNVNYDENDVLQYIQFTKPYFDHEINKNDFIDNVFDVFNAGFRVIAYINKELN